MAASRCIPTTQLSALLLLISITISPLLAQDPEIISFAQEDLSALSMPILALIAYN